MNKSSPMKPHASPAGMPMRFRREGWVGAVSEEEFDIAVILLFSA
jgi:hypothetical protein